MGDGSSGMSGLVSSSGRTADGLRRDCLSTTEVVAQAVGVIAPPIMPALALPSVYGSAGHGA